MIAILGGGIAGASLAWALARRGRRDVLVLDPNEPAAGSTGRAMGGFRTQFVNPLNIALSLAARPFFVQHAARIAFRSNGYLLTAWDAQTAAALRARAEVQVAAGLPIEHPDPRALLPFFDARDVLATNFCRLDGTYYPPLILQAFIEEAEAAGARFRYGAEVRPAQLDAELLVVAAGIWSPQVGAELGVRLAITPEEHGIFAVKAFEGMGDTFPLTIDSGNGWAFRERDGRLLVHPPDDPHDWERVREWLARYIPAAATEQPLDHWTGSYEVTFDHHPLVGQTERPGVWASCGFSGHGVMHAPSLADNLAAMILGDTPALDISSLSPLRTEPLHDPTQV